ncbi:hypothetical protein ACERJO_00895 [Halalkalibacter sp. AB-rgal2]|uniref:hypothetical protein n=1 Tax=Halalkalibacter sp. AB-rgal2 TaxID=3242695 RepID=UPI00359EE54E|nr:hypothetical protein [Halalkalibacter sp. APA_J-10(15)]
MKWFTGILVLVITFIIGVCATTSEQNLSDKITVYTPHAPSLIPLVLVAEEDENLHVETWNTVEGVIES